MRRRALDAPRTLTPAEDLRDQYAAQLPPGHDVILEFSESRFCLTATGPGLQERECVELAPEDAEDEHLPASGRGRESPRTRASRRKSQEISPVTRHAIASPTRRSREPDAQVRNSTQLSRGMRIKPATCLLGKRGLSGSPDCQAARFGDRAHGPSHHLANGRIPS
jgi:hypothetical protein